MSGVRIEIGFDDGGLRRAIGRAVTAGADLREPLEGSGALLESSTRGRFDSGMGPDGVPWLPSRRAVETGGQTLKDTGNLQDSIRYEVGTDEVEVGVDGRNPSSEHAATHQFGAHITPKNGPFLVFTSPGGGLVFAREVDIPARPFLGIDAADVSDLELLWGDYMMEPWRGH